MVSPVGGVGFRPVELANPKGGRTKIRINKKGRKNSQTNRHGFIGKWIEPKLVTIYVVDEQGKKIKNSDKSVKIGLKKPEKP
jgi:hypothetical protein